MGFDHPFATPHDVDAAAQAMEMTGDPSHLSDLKCLLPVPAGCDLQLCTSMSNVCIPRQTFPVEFQSCFVMFQKHKH